jgi:hypothetical protein
MGSWNGRVRFNSVNNFLSSLPDLNFDRVGGVAMSLRPNDIVAFISASSALAILLGGFNAPPEGVALSLGAPAIDIIIDVN